MMTTARQGLFIVGTGARTPLGFNAPASAAAVRAGIGAMQHHPYMIDKYGEPMVVTIDSELPTKLNGVDRLLKLAVPPALEALIPLLEKEASVLPIHVFVALPEERPGRPENLENEFGVLFSERLAETIQVEKLTNYALGHAGGLVCMEHALSLINSGKCELCLVGGVESYLEAETLEWLDDHDQLHSESTIYGFCPGEGAGFCLLSSQDFARRLSLNASVKLLSAASAEEANRIKTETVCIGEGLSEAFQKALLGLPSQGSQVDHVICDMNGERYRGNEYGFAMLRNSGCFAEASDFQTPADCWGDVGAASGPLFTMLAAFASKKGYAPGPLTFLWASSEGGQRAALPCCNRRGKPDAISRAGE